MNMDTKAFRIDDTNEKKARNLEANLIGRIVKDLGGARSFVPWTAAERAEQRRFMRRGRESHACFMDAGPARQQRFTTARS